MHSICRVYVIKKTHKTAINYAILHIAQQPNNREQHNKKCMFNYDALYIQFILYIIYEQYLWGRRPPVIINMIFIYYYYTMIVLKS
jgi:hypothetical protein